MTPPRVTITDHALIRYMQRVLGIDVEAHRRDLCKRLTAAYRDGACGVVIDGHSCRIVATGEGTGIVCTTVLSGTLLNRKTGRGRK